MPTQTVEWSPRDLAYKLNGREMKAELPKGAADAVAQEAKARLGVIATRIQSGEITLKQGRQEAKYASKMMVMAEKALARGGWDQMKPADWKAAEKDVLELWEGKTTGKFRHGGMVKVFDDAEKGYFGPDLQDNSFNYWMQRPVGQGHAIYENERTNLHVEQGFGYAMRLMAAVHNCPTCEEENGVKRLIDEVVPIGESECRDSCRCVIIFDRDEDGLNEKTEEAKQQEREAKEERAAEKAEAAKERAREKDQAKSRPRPDRPKAGRVSRNDDDLVSVGDVNI